MKLRILDNSFRFRITLRELESLTSTGRIESSSRFPDESGQTANFCYAVTVEAEAATSGLRVAPFRIELVLSLADLKRLADPAVEGIYCRREWLGAEDQPLRAMVFLEKDRPVTSCAKPETWIYDDRPVAPQTGATQEF